MIGFFLFIFIVMGPILWQMKPKKHTMKNTPKGGQTIHSCELNVGHAKVWAHYVAGNNSRYVGFRNLDLARQFAMPTWKKNEKV